MESERTENKSSLAEWREVVESVAAFATSGGGQVRIGIGPDGRRTGVRLGRGSLEDLANKIKVNTDPAQFPWGTGTLRMIQAAKDQGMKLEFGEDGGVFMARFLGMAQAVGLSDDVQFTARQEKVLRYLAEHGTITRREYRSLFHVSERQSLRDLTEMMERGYWFALARVAQHAISFRCAISARFGKKWRGANQFRWHDRGAIECGIRAGFA